MEFTCISDEEVTWYFNEGDLPSNVQRDGNPQKSSYRIIINNIQISNKGTYTCYGVMKDLTSTSKHRRRDYFYDEGVLDLKCK